jgi:uncharacterized membrane protein YphA (DoxX/SURF4 family)
MVKTKFMALSGKLTYLARRTLEGALGGLFVFAGLQKHFRPQEFADAVLAYQLLPDFLVGLVAAGLPWVELAAGTFLILGIKRRSCLILLGGMLATFILALLITWARGLKIDCGCGLFLLREVGPGAILQNAAFLLLIAALYWWELLGAAPPAQLRHSHKPPAST